MKQKNKILNLLIATTCLVVSGNMLLDNFTFSQTLAIELFGLGVLTMSIASQDDNSIK